MMSTRSAEHTKPLSEDELETVRQQIAQREERIRAEAAALQQQREEFAQQEEHARAKIAAFQQQLEELALREEHIRATVSAMKQERAKFNEIQRRNGDLDQSIFSSFKEELLRELESLRRDLDHLRSHEKAITAPETSCRYEREFSPLRGEPPFKAFQPTVSFRMATEAVPDFDGYNIPLHQFARACRRAKKIVPPSEERILTKLLINKLRGLAILAVEDEPCDSVIQLIDLLSAEFSSKTIDQYRGELSTSYFRKHEHILDYIERVGDLRCAILDAETQRLRGTLDDKTLRDVDLLTIRSFCDGLPLEYRLQMRPEFYSHPAKAFSAAEAIAQREELDRERYDRTSQTPRSPLTHSTSRHDPISARYETRDIPPRCPASPRRLNYSRGDPASVIRNRGNYDGRAPRTTETGHLPRHNINTKWCRYCKNPGHEIKECRKREYNNSHSRQRNFVTPSKATDKTRAGKTQGPSRPIRPIEARADEPELESPP